MTDSMPALNHPQIARQVSMPSFNWYSLYIGVVGERLVARLRLFVAKTPQPCRSRSHTSSLQTFPTVLVATFNMLSHEAPVPYLCLCRSQHICAFHKDRKIVKNPSSTTTKPNHDSVVMVRGTLTTKNEQVPSLFLRLPHELLLMIFEHMDLIGRLNLALTCQTMANILEKDVLVAAMRRSEAKDVTNSFLSLLGRDLHIRYWHCDECVVLHPRLMPERRASSSIVGLRRLIGLFRRT
jgi:hypothetical protein